MMLDWPERHQGPCGLAQDQLRSVLEWSERCQQLCCVWNDRRHDAFS